MRLGPRRAQKHVAVHRWAQRSGNRQAILLCGRAQGDGHTHPLGKRLQITFALCDRDRFASTRWHQNLLRTTAPSHSARIREVANQHRRTMLLATRLNAIAFPSRALDSLHMAAGRPRFLEAIERNPQQAEFVRDPSKRKTALCGRRGGKTTGIAGWLYGGMVDKPGTRQVYIGLSRGLARQILWDNIMVKMVKEYGLPLRETTRDGHLIIQHANGSSLWIAGCNDKREIDKFRGQPFFRVNIDEAQGFPDELLQLLVEDAIEPALGDYDGQIALTGTPSPIDVGYFHGATTGTSPGWSHHHHWDVRANPHFAARAEEYLAQVRANHGWSEDHPTYQREYLGRWVHDASALIYPFTHETNSWTPAGEEFYGLNPAAEWSFGLGIDLGYSEGAKTLAFTLAAAQRATGNGYLLRSYLKDRMYPGKLAAYCQDMRERVRNVTGCHLRIVVDEGGLGGGWTEQMEALGVTCEAAEKSNKRAYQEYVGGLISTGQLKANYPACADLLSEARKLQFDDDSGKEDERFRRHCCDSMLYIVRALFPKYAPETQGPVPAFGTPAHHALQMKTERARMIRESLRKKR